MHGYQLVLIGDHRKTEEMRPRGRSWSHWRLVTIALKEMGNSSLWSLSLLILFFLDSLCSMACSQHDQSVNSETEHKWHHLITASEPVSQSNFSLKNIKNLVSVLEGMQSTLWTGAIFGGWWDMNRFWVSSLHLLQSSGLIPQKRNSHVPTLAFPRRRGEAAPATVWSETGRQEERTKPKSFLIKAKVLWVVGRVHIFPAKSPPQTTTSSCTDYLSLAEAGKRGDKQSPGLRCKWHLKDGTAD